MEVFTSVFSEKGYRFRITDLGVIVERERRPKKKTYIPFERFNTELRKLDRKIWNENCILVLKRIYYNIVGNRD